MEKKAQIHMLPTSGASRMFLHRKTLYSMPLLSHEEGQYNGANQHLYFTSDEEIKEGYWFYDSESILQCSRVTDVIIDTQGLWSDLKNCKKVVATTNPELWSNKPTAEKLYNPSIAHIGDDFVEAYIKAYNEGKPITEVNLEYESKYIPVDEIDGIGRVPILKLRSNGTVIISPVVAEKFMTRAEALAMLEDYDREFKLDTFAYTKAPSFTVENWFNNKYK